MNRNEEGQEHVGCAVINCHGQLSYNIVSVQPAGFLIETSL